MVLKMFSLFDKKTAIYQPPIYCHNEAHAIRVFEQEFAKDNVLSRYSADFALFELGTFVDGSGKIIGNTEPKFVIDGTALVAGQKKES